MKTIDISPLIFGLIAACSLIACGESDANGTGAWVLHNSRALFPSSTPKMAACPRESYLWLMSSRATSMPWRSGD